MFIQMPRIPIHLFWITQIRIVVRIAEWLRAEVLEPDYVVDIWHYYLDSLRDLRVTSLGLGFLI